MLSPVQITPDVWWVGAVDWNERDFHGYTTDRGSTYNAYLILDEHPTLIDAVKAPFVDELLTRVSQLVDPSRIEYVISNHVEMDHSSALPRVLAAAPNAKLVTSDPKGLAGLKAHYGDGFAFLPVQSGDTLSIGARTLTFVHTPMVHWPDSMVTYSDLDKILFSMDIFGQHYASSKRFDHEVPLGEVLAEAKKYYANIVMPYGKKVVKTLHALAGLDAEVLAPAHGMIWRRHAGAILERYGRWSSDQLDEYAIVVYDSMWNSTEKMALAITEAFIEEGIPTRLFDLKVNHVSDIITETLDARYVAVGSPTLNTQMMPTVAAFLCYLKGLTPKSRKAIGIPFGSYGWSEKSISLIAEDLAGCGMDMPFGQLARQWVPDEADLLELQQIIRDGIDEVRTNDAG